MAIPSNPTTDAQSEIAVLFNQALRGIAAISEADLLSQMSSLPLNDGIVKNKTALEFYKNELKEVFGVSKTSQINNQALIDLMETNLGIDIPAGDELALLGLGKAQKIVQAFLARTDVQAEYDPKIDVYQGQLATGTAEFGADSSLLNEAPTDIIPNSASVAEDAAGGALITTLQAVDPDTGDTHTFALVSDASGKFDVLSNGEVRLKPGAQLDFETTTSYQITVETTDQWGDSYQEVLTINVTDVEPEPGNTVVLDPGTDLIDASNDATVNDDLFLGSSVFSQNFFFGPINVTGTATPGDFIDGDDGNDVFQLSLSGSVFNPFQDVVSTGIITENIETLVVVNSVQGADDVIVDMTTHQDVENVSVLFSSSDIMLRDMQNAGGTILIQDPSLGDEMDVNIDFDLQALAGADDQLTVQVDEVNGADIEITQDAESNGGGLGDGDPANLENSDD